MKLVADDQFEEKSQQQDSEFRAVFDHSAEGILIADVESKKFRQGNNAMCHMLGYSPEEIKSLGVTDIHPEKDLPYVLDQFERQGKREFTLSRDLPVKRKDGSVFFADVNATTIKINDKVYLIGFFHDTSERRKIEEELKQKNGELERMNKLMVGREIKMIELKEALEKANKQIAELGKGVV